MKKKTEELKELFNRAIKDEILVDKLNAMEWVALGVILLLVLLTLFYGDNLGMFLTYYWVNEGLFLNRSVRFLGNNQLPYGVIQQWFCQIWVLPVNIIRRFTEFEPDVTLAVIWYKLSMSFVMLLSLSEIQKIARIMKIQKVRIKWLLILFSSTILVALPVFHIAQSDILYTYICLIGLRFFLKDDNKRFLICFAMAISCKAIAVVIFVPMVLLKEKRILYILRDMLIGASLFLVERVWYKIVDKLDMLIATRKEAIVITQEVTGGDGEVTVVEKTLDQVNEGFFSHFYHKALYFEFPAVRKGYMASLLVVLFVLLCIWCYTQYKEDEDIWMQKVIYTVAVAWLLFFVNASPSPYWIVTLYPYWFLLIFVKPDRIKTNLILHNVFTLTMFLVYVVNTDWVYGGSCNLDYLLLRGLLKEGHDSVDGPYVARYLNNMGIESYMNVITAICLAAAIGLVVINHNRCKIDDRISDGEENALMHGFTIWQIGVLFVWYAINVWTVQRW